MLTAATERARSGVLADETGTMLDGPAIEGAVAALAGGLRAAGVRRGDVVAWQAPNWHEVILLYRACWRLGAIAGPIHHQAGPTDVERFLAVLQPRVWLPSEDIRGPGARYSTLLEGTPVTVSAARPSDLAAVLFTSGSTGGPKAALHTQRGLAYKAEVMAAAHQLTPADAILMPAPLAHVSGLLNAVLVAGAVPMRVHLMARWDPAAALDTIDAATITFMIGPPTFFVSLMEAPSFREDRVTSLRLVSSGGAGVSPAFVDEARARLQATVKRTYGSTEAPTVTTSPSDAPLSRARDTDGQAVGSVQLRVSDPATGTRRPAGEPGELWLRGPELFAGDVAATQTQAAVTRGWFRTGDLATVDADGWLTVVGRIKDTIIRGGENIAAAEVELILERHPDVVQAVAVGYPDPRYGERVCAFVVARRPFDLAACQAWFEHEGVARFKTPERVVTLEELPLLSAGKADRAVLRAHAEAGEPG